MHPTRSERFVTRAVLAAAAVGVAAAAVVGGRDALVTVAAAGAAFLLVAAAAGVLLFALARGELPRRIGRDEVEFSAEDDAATAASFRSIDEAVTDVSTKLAEVVRALADVAARVDALEERAEHG